MKKILFLLSFLFIALGLSAQPNTYIEDFEKLTKLHYPSATVTLNDGYKWNFTGSCAGKLGNNWYNPAGTTSARLAGATKASSNTSVSKIQMLSNKIGGIGSITFDYRRYSSDEQIPWKVEWSSDDGNSWTKIGTITGTADVKTFTYNLNQPEARIRIIADGFTMVDNDKANGKRLNVDDIVMTDYDGTIPNITISSPVEGDIWLHGSTHDITWDCANINATTVDIKLYKGGVYQQTIATEPIANKSWTWSNIPSELDGNDYTIVIEAGVEFSATNGQFSIIAPIQAPKIFISEYIEGSEKNRAVEIYNGTGEFVDLTKLEVRNYINGGSTPHALSDFTGYLNPGEVYVISHHNSTLEGITNYDNSSVDSYFMAFNGDDALEIVYDGVVCDVFGEIGVDPGTGWEVAGVANATANHTLLRKLHITQGNTESLGSFGTDANDSEWTVNDQNYTANLGHFGAVLITQDPVSGNTYDVPVDAVATFDLITNNDLDITSKIDSINNIILKKEGTTNITIQPNANIGIVGNIVDKSPAASPTPATATFNIKSTAAGTGTLMHNFEASGNIERYISGNEVLTANCYHGVSIPLYQYGSYQSGLFTGSYLYRFDEPANSWIGMGSSTTTTLDAKQGYLIYYPGDDTIYNFEGSFNHNAIYMPLSVQGQGFNFMPNLYTSHIKFSKITTIPSDAIDNGFWVWDASKGNYTAYNVSAGTGTTTSSDTISIGQAFFVKASSGGAFKLSPDCRVRTKEGSTTPFYSPGPKLNILRIAANGNQLQDEILFVFDNEWDLGSDEGDMLKMIGSTEAPQLSSINADYEKLTLNTLPLNRYETVIPLSFTLNASTQVQFVTDNSKLQSDITPYLIDKKANRTINLRQNPVYTFNHENTDTDNRFEIKFVNAVYSTPFDLADENVIYVNSNNQIVISVPSMQNTKTLVNVYDMQGKLVSSNTVYLTDTFVTEAPVVSGVYMVIVVNSTQAVNKKVVVAR